MNWPHREGYVPASESRTQARTGKNNLELQMGSHPMFPDGSPWSTWFIGNDMDDAMEKAAHVALTALCSLRLLDTAGTPISLYLVQDRSDLEWTARIDKACNIF
jgi:hypothetical protein